MRYVLHPGNVVNKTDGDVHYVSYDRLIELYKLDPRDCVNRSKLGFEAKADDIHLWSDCYGNYKLPELKNSKTLKSMPRDEHGPSAQDCYWYVVLRRRQQARMVE